jgi:hypothetical protein
MQKNNIIHITHNPKLKNNAIKLLTKQFNDTKNSNNLKKLLCNNYLEIGKCNYGNKCLYSHSLSEQKVDPIRKKIYDILNDYLAHNNISDDNISEINDNKEINKSLLQLTKVCNDCLLGKCPGGYNCKHGAINEKYKICYNDLTDECLDTTCPMIHLSKFNISVNKKNIKNKSINNNQIVGKLLTDMFFKLKNSNDDASITTESDDSLSDTSFDRINNYLNDSPSEDPYNESIFIFN